MDWTKIATDMLRAGTKRRPGSGFGSRAHRPRKPWWWGVVALLIAGGSYLAKQYSNTTPSVPAPSTQLPPGAPTSDTLAELIRNRRSDVPIQLSGEVVRVLADDTQTPRHQRFIVRVNGGSTVLITHNIDLAPRAPVKEGAPVSIKGDYIWNDQGGLIHWTHHDPAGRHPGGWVEVMGKRYE